MTPAGTDAPARAASLASRAAGGSSSPHEASSSGRPRSVLERALERHATRVEHARPRSAVGDLGQVVGDVQNPVPGCAKPGHDCQDVGSALGIEHRRGLVEHEIRRLASQARQRSPAAASDRPTAGAARAPPSRVRPTAARASSTRLRMTSRARPRFSGPKATSSSTEVATIWSSGCWNTTPTPSRAAPGCRDSSSVRMPSTVTDPRLRQQDAVGKPREGRLARAVRAHHRDLFARRDRQRLTPSSARTPPGR